MAITGLQEVLYGVDDMDAADRFWSDFGLRKQPGEKGSLVYATQEGANVVVRPSGDAELPSAPVLGPTVRRVTWAVQDARTLEVIAEALGSERTTFVSPEGNVHATDPAGHAIAFTLSRLRQVKHEPTGFNTPGNTQRLNQRAKIYAKADPVRMAHVVFAVRNLQETADFYVQRLGFRVTDSYRDSGVFLKCPGSDDHHHLFLLSHGDATGFHHLAFDVRDIHELFGGGLHMTAQGWKTHIGPGRHPLSSAYFWYFKNPCGGAAEYDFDSDVVTDEWEPRVYERTPANFAEWAFADGASRFTGIQTGRA